MSSDTSSKSITLIHLAISAVVIVFCLLLMLNSAQYGFSKILGRYAVATNSIFAADEAVRLAPSDPQAHQARAIVLNKRQSLDQAIREFEIAVSLRYRDDYLWLELGGLRESIGNRDAALAAFNRAIEFAPYYGHTHWQRGNLFVRMGQYEQGFADLRVAVNSHRELLPALIDLAWGISRHDLKVTEQLLQLSDDKDRIALTRYLALTGDGHNAINEFRQITTPVPSEIRNDLTRALIEQKAYSEAYEVWNGSASTRSLVNADFEDTMSFDDEPGFSWRAIKQGGVAFALDRNEPHNGSRSLRITFDGYQGQAEPILSQLIAVEPDQRYRVTFAIKTHDLVTGGLPFAVATDAATNQVLGRSNSFQPNVDTWADLSFEFRTLPTTKGVFVSLQRAGCSALPCPIFGMVWLDSFALQTHRDE